MIELHSHEVESTGSEVEISGDEIESILRDQANQPETFAKLLRGVTNRRWEEKRPVEAEKQSTLTREKNDKSLSATMSFNHSPT